MDISTKFQSYYTALQNKIEEPVQQRRLILVIVSAALLLDNMLYMVIVPIIPDYLRRVNAWDVNKEYSTTNVSINGSWVYSSDLTDVTYEGEDTSLGFLFASKAFVQLLANPISGTLIDRIGYEPPLIFGLFVMFVSTSTFAFGKTYHMLFIARCMQGIGSAFADTAALAMIADKFTDEKERNRALGIALAFISFGFLFAPPFGGVLYEFLDKEVPFLVLASVALLDAGLIFLVSGKRSGPHKVAGQAHAPMYRLILDPHVAVICGALVMSNVALAFLEPTIATWMQDSMDADQWQQGIVWLPGFFPHIFGVFLCVKLSNKYAKSQWIYAGVGLFIIGFSTCFIPFTRTIGELFFPLCGICFGIALVDTSLIPALSYLVDVRYTSVYGSVYALADISYSTAYAFGPVVAGTIVHAFDFTFLNLLVGITNMLYAPTVIYLKSIYAQQADSAARKYEQSSLIPDDELGNCEKLGYAAMQTTIDGGGMTGGYQKLDNEYDPTDNYSSYQNKNSDFLVGNGKLQFGGK